jgi:hypothetical protein
VEGLLLSLLSLLSHEPRRTRQLLAALLALVAVGLSVAGPAGAVPGGGEPPSKVLVVTTPALRWADLAAHDLPRLEAFLAGADVGMLSMRTIGARTSLGEGYATLGSGNRASVGTADAGMALEPHERFEEGTAGQVFERRTAVDRTGQLLHLAFPTIARLNSRFLYGAEPGALGEALGAEGHSVAVVANADIALTLPEEPQASEPASSDVPVGEEEEPVEGGDTGEEPVPEEPVGPVVDAEDPPPLAVPFAAANYGRAAVLAGMDRTGQVALGDADGLLTRAPDAPYGIRYDSDAVVDAFERVWEDADLAFVELSDLDRADSYRSVATMPAADALWTDALASSDALFGRLLDAVPDDTTVLVVTPAGPRAAETLGIFALGEPAGGGGGLVRSGATRRAGYVSLTDVAPTILRHFGVASPTSMTGTLISRAERAEIDEGRFAQFTDRTAEAVFRDKATGPVSVVFVVAQIVAYALAAVAVARRRRWTRPVSFLALVILATPPVVFLVGALHVSSGTVVAYLLGIFAVAVLLAAGAEALAVAVATRWPRTRAMVAPLALVTLTWMVLAVDIVSGGRLQINTVFGYSPLVAGRFAGLGNLAFALVGIGSVVITCGWWATFRLARQRADGSARARGVTVVAMVLFLAATVVIDGAPAWGADVGGVLATVPAFAVLVLVAMGVRVGWRRAVLIALATVAAISAFAAVDLARAEEDRTHLGRLVARVTDSDGGGGFLEVLQRKINSNLSILTSSVWTLTIPFALGLLIYLARKRSGFLRDLQEDVPGIRAMLAGGLLVAVLGFALNDSGVAVPAMMFAVLLPYLTYVLLRWDPAER